jgi:hypothetical protein
MYNNNEINRLLNEDPATLIRAALDPLVAVYELTFIAEAIGSVPIELQREARSVLMNLLSHENIVVREGAVRGLDIMEGEKVSKDEYTRVIKSKYRYWPL